MEKDQSKKVRINIDCSPEERKMIRLLAAKKDTSISKYLLELARSEIQKESKFLLDGIRNT